MLDKTTVVAPRNKTSAGGSFRIDKQLKRLGLGRLQMASGTTDPEEFARINALLDQLVSLGETDLLRGLIGRDITIAELRDAQRSLSLTALRERLRTMHPANADTQRATAATTADVQTVSIHAPAAPLLVPTDVRSSAVETRVKDSYDDLDDGEIDDREVLQRPFWPLLTNPETWKESDADARSRGRYQQSFRSLGVRLGLARLERDELVMLATLPHDFWTALEHVNRRGIPVAMARAIVESGEVPRKFKKKKRRGPPARRYSMRNRVTAAPPVSNALTQARLGHDAVIALRGLRHDQWDVLAKCADRVPTRAMVLGVAQLAKAPRDALGELAQVLNPAALTRDVGRTRKHHWKALWAAWNGSEYDFNHLRRALSAALTCAFGFSGHRTRAKLMLRLQLQPVSARVADLDYETFERILAEIPVHYQPAFRTLLQTGLRLGEFVRLKPEHLNPRARIVYVPGTKNAASARPIRVHEDFWPDLLAAVPCPIGESGLYQVWVKAREIANAPTARQHDLRHAFGQWSLETGVQDSEVQQALRQKSSNITADYRRMKQTEAASAGLAKVMRRNRTAAAKPHAEARALSSADGVVNSD
jgi:integrase